MSVPIPPAPDPPHPPDSHSLRLGTLNIGLALQRKLPSLLQRCTALTLDAVALQEIGDPALLESRFAPYRFIYSAGPSHHQAGVGLLLSQALVPHIRCYRRSTTGRLVGAVLELHKGHQLLLVSVYMPSGLDHSAAGSEQLRLASSLYRELLGWTAGMQQVLLLGDFNETLSRFDRLPLAPAHRAPHPATMHSLIAGGFTDEWRRMHPCARTMPGFTHSLPGDRLCMSRLDYIWSKGFAPDAQRAMRIDAALSDLSHHRLLWLELELPHAAPPPPAALLRPLRVPNLRDLSSNQKSSFGRKLTEQLQREEADVRAAIAEASALSLSHAASTLTRIVQQLAATRLPQTGDTPRQSRCILQLQRQRTALSRLLRASEILLAAAPPELRTHPLCLTSSPEWKRQFLRCALQHQLHWRIDICSSATDARLWIAETREILRATCRAVRQEQRRMLRERKPPLDADPAALVHRMLQSDALPTQLLSVVNSQGELTSSAAELEEVMVDHFTSVFAVPPPSDVPLPHPVPAMLLDKTSVDASWFDGLMSDVTPEELLAVTAGTPLVSAAGEDQVSSGVWKLALGESGLAQELVSDLFSACLRTSLFPAAWKTSIIVPLVKDAQKERTMSNVRPISLQSCLGKLLNKLLAHRLGDTFARHPILHPAQRGFVNGGTITKCIDELLDAWDWSRSGKHEQYTLLYDIRQAYDSVQVDVLRRVMKRLRMPAAFIDLVVDSLTGLSSCVRTAYGLSRAFAVLRSLRQGDPLAPLLFVILMDALHDGLELNPFDHVRHGLHMAMRNGVSMDVPSLGYADDTSVLTNTLQALRVQNDWVHYFMTFNRLRLNHAKCELVGRDAAGQPVTSAALAAAGITIDGNALEPVPHAQPIRYLGVHMSFDGSWAAQQRKAVEKTAMFSRAVVKFNVTLRQAVYMYNVFLMPMLELALHYMHGPGTAKCIKQCDRLIIGSIKHVAGSLLSLSHTAVALTLGLLLPSWLETSVKTSELFLRMNDPDARWGELGRVLMRQSIGSSVMDASSVSSRKDGGTRTSRAVHLAVKQLGWSLQLREQPRAGSRHAHLLSQLPLDTSYPSLDECSSTSTHTLAAGQTRLAQDVWRGWGTTEPDQQVHVYTDGSFDPASKPHPTSSWAVTVADSWLERHLDAIPADEKLLRAHHVAGASAFAASITYTRGIYPAELQAVARALAMFPVTFRLLVHSDSEACIKAIGAYQALTSERRRMRMAARPILQLIHRLLQQREAAGGSARFAHVRAHTMQRDIHSVGNRISDYHANLARLHPDQPQPLALRQLPLLECERHLTITDERTTGLQLIDDVRRTSLVQLKQLSQQHWQSKSDGREFFAGDAVLELGRVVVRRGSAQQQHTLVHVATNSIHYHFAPVAGPGSATKLQQLQCEDCGVALTLGHLAVCRAQLGEDYRAQLHRDILDLFADEPQAAAWVKRHQGAGSLRTLLFDLFPVPSEVAAMQPASLEAIAARGKHLAHAMCGVFTSTAATSAAKTAGFNSLNPDDVRDGQRCIYRLRLLCLDSAERLFTARKDVGVG